MFDVLIFGGGVSGISCALILGSAHKKDFAQSKKIGVFTHQKASSLQDAIFYNAYGIHSGKLGSELLTESTLQLELNYRHLEQIANEKVLKISKIPCLQNPRQGKSYFFSLLYFPFLCYILL